MVIHGLVERPEPRNDDRTFAFGKGRHDRADACVRDHHSGAAYELHELGVAEEGDTFRMPRPNRRGAVLHDESFLDVHFVDCSQEAVEGD